VKAGKPIAKNVWILEARNDGERKKKIIENFKGDFMMNKRIRKVTLTF
jgi:hypothetical protein